MSTANVQQLARDLAALLQMGVEAVEQPRVLELAQAYSAASLEVNARLQRAADWLRSGLLSEALHFAEQHPDAINDAASLELGVDGPRWLELCRLCGVTGVTPVASDLAAELSRAYNDRKKLDGLLAKHRALALVAAPLEDRLSVARELQKADPVSPVWPEQCTLLERARCSELLRDANQAVKNGDVAALQAVESTLAMRSWAKPPTRLLDAVRSQLRDLKGRSGVHEFRRVGALLHEAHGAGDAERVRDLLRAWDGIGLRTGASPDADGQAEADAVRQWLEGIDRERARAEEYERRVAELRQSLDEDAPYPDLERIHAQVLLLDRAVPIATQRRFEERRKVFEIERARKHRLVTFAALAAAVLAGAVVWWIIWTRQRSAEVLNWKEQIAAAIERSEIEAAGDLIRRLHADAPGAAAAPELQALETRWLALKAQDDQRAGDFRKLIEAVKQRDGTEPGVFDDLKRLESLARTEPEKADAAGERLRLEAQQRRMQAELDGPFIEERRKLLEEHARLGTEELAPEARSALLAQIVQKFDVLLTRSGVSPEQMASARTARDAIANERGAIDTKLRRAGDLLRELERLPAEARSASDLAERMQRFVDAYAESPQAARLSEALTHQRAWRAIESIAGELAPLAREVAVRSAADARSRVEVVRRAAALFKQESVAVVLDEYARYLAHAAAVLDSADDGLKLRSVQTLLNEPWVSSLSHVEDETGRRYYSLGGELKGIGQGRANLSEYLKSLGDLDARARRASVIVKVPAGVAVADALQKSDLAQAAKSIKVAVDSTAQSMAGWETIHLQMALAVASAKNVDPLLAAVIISDCIERHQTVGWPARPELSKLREQIEAAAIGGKKLVDLDWVDDGDPTRLGRVEARRILAARPDFEAIIQSWVDFQTRVSRACQPLRFAGVTWPDEQGEAHARTVGRHVGAELFVVEGDDASIKIRSVGATDEAGKTRWGASGPPPLGTPLFVREAKP